MTVGVETGVRHRRSLLQVHACPGEEEGNTGQHVLES